MDDGTLLALGLLGFVALAALFSRGRERVARRSADRHAAWQASGREATLPQGGPPLGRPVGVLVREHGPGPAHGPLIAAAMLGQPPIYEPHPQAATIRARLGASYGSCHQPQTRAMPPAAAQAWSPRAASAIWCIPDAASAGAVTGRWERPGMADWLR